MNDVFDEELTLLKKTYTESEIGERIEIVRGTEIYCKRKPISRYEFFEAGKSGIELKEIFIIHPFEYENETEVVFNGTALDVIKTYLINSNELELTCITRGVNNG